MTSVGYGDSFPKTTLSRFVGSLLSLWGSLQVGLFIISITNILEWDNTELFAYNVLEKLEDRQHLAKQAITVMQKKYRYTKAKRDTNTSDRTAMNALYELRTDIIPFLASVSKLRGNNNPTELDIIKDKVEDIQNEIKNMHLQMV